MGFFDKLRQVFKRSASMQSDATAMLHRFEAMAPSPQPSPTELPPLAIEKDSLQLGIAAGYTGRSLRNIEDSLSRIEAQMVTKDWMTLTVKSDLEKKLDTIQGSLESIAQTTTGLPPSVREGILSEVRRIQAALQPTVKMTEVLSLIREAKEISYEDLASKAGIEISSLRGLLSLMGKRTTLIERFERGNRGWVMYREPVTAMQSDAEPKMDTKPENQEQRT